MNATLKKTCAIVSFAALAACSEDFGGFHTEAGKFLDEGGFGNPTMNNLGVQSGEQSFAIAMTKKFASDVNPTVNFDFNRWSLDDESKATLNAQADWIKQFPEARFRVFGHTDLVGSEGYNDALGMRRANAVVNYLVSRGISRDRLEAVVSKGETQPLIVTEERERRNRRATTEVSGVASGLASELNGKYAEVIWREYVQSATQGQTTFAQETTDGGGE